MGEAGLRVRAHNPGTESAGYATGEGIDQKGAPGPMSGIERTRLTPRERMIVLSVLLLALIALAAWISVMVLMLPNPGHGSV